MIFFKYKSLISHIAKYAIAVAIAAPNAPYCGINTIFIIVLIIADNTVVVAIILVDLAAENILPINAVSVLNMVAIKRIDEYFHATKKSSEYKNFANGMFNIIIIEHPIVMVAPYTLYVREKNLSLSSGSNSLIADKFHA